MQKMHTTMHKIYLKTHKSKQKAATNTANIKRQTNPTSKKTNFEKKYGKQLTLKFQSQIFNKKFDFVIYKVKFKKIEFDFVIYKVKLNLTL